jgi:hypothetical protein
VTSSPETTSAATAVYTGATTMTTSVNYALSTTNYVSSTQGTASPSTSDDDVPPTAIASYVTSLGKCPCSCSRLLNASDVRRTAPDVIQVASTSRYRRTKTSADTGNPTHTGWSKHIHCVSVVSFLLLSKIWRAG